MKKILAVITALLAVFGTAALPSVSSTDICVIADSADEETIVSGDYEYIVLDDGNAEITKYTGKETEVSLPAEIDGKKVTRFGKIFYKNTELKKIVIPNGVTNIGLNALSGCKSLTSVKIPESVQTIGTSAFHGCKSLKSIEIPDSVTAIGMNAFFNCNSLTGIKLSKNLKAINQLTFIRCLSLTSIDIPDSVTSIGSGAFCNCEKLSSIKIPSSVKSIDSNAFAGCKALSKVELSDSIVTIDVRAFENCESLKSITIPDSVSDIEENAFGYLSDGKVSDFKISCYMGTAGEKYAVDNGFEYDVSYRDLETAEFSLSTLVYNYDGKPKTPVVKITKGEQQLEKDKDYTVKYSDNIKIGTATITITGMGDFAGEKVLNFVIKDPDDQNDNSCGENLKWSLDKDGTLTVSGTGKMNSYEYGGAPWYDEAALIKKAVLEDGVESIGSNAFSGLENLASVEIPDSVTEISDYAFTSDSGLKEINGLDTTISAIGAYAFDDTAWLSAMREKDPLVIVNGLLIDGRECSGDIVIPDGVTAISAYAFSNNKDITSVKLPDSVSEIRDRAFDSCQELKKIEIPNSVKKIFDKAFSNCSADLTILGTEPSYVRSFADKHGFKFEQLKTDIGGCEIYFDKDSYEFEGKPVEAVTNVTLEGTLLTRDIDYTVEYVNNDKPGTAAVKIKGCGGYTGTADASFEITGKGGTSVRGDVNNDGIVNVSDISKLAAHVKGHRALSDDELTRSDINGDNEINVKDISPVAAHVKGIRSLE